MHMMSVKSWGLWRNLRYTLSPNVWMHELRPVYGELSLVARNFHVENLLIIIYSTSKIAFVSLLVFTTEQYSKLNASSILQSCSYRIIIPKYYVLMNCT